MIRKNDDDLFIEKFKTKVAIMNFENNNKQKNQNLLNNKIDWRIYNMKRKVAILISTGLLALSSVCFAVNFNNIKNYFTGLGEGMDRAVQNGYIEEVKMEPQETEMKFEGKYIDNINTTLSIENFVMDDKNLCVQFKIVFDDSLKEEIDFDKIHHIDLNDLYILDENNILMYHTTTKEFEKICEKHNLEYGEFDDKSMNCGLNSFIQSHNGNEFILQYNIYTTQFPKSKKLDFYLSKIKFEFEDNIVQQEKQEPVILTNGNWEIHLDVPEKFYNRTEEYYSVVSTTNDKINVYQAKLTDTGIEIGLTIDGEKEPKHDIELEKKRFELVEKYTYIDENGVSIFSNNDELYEELDKIQYAKKNAEFNRAYNAVWDNEFNYDIKVMSYAEIKKANESGQQYYKMPPKEKLTGVENSKGEKFLSTMSPSREAHSQYIDGDKFDYYETFGMGKADSTDEITVVVNHRGTLEYIKMKKIK